MDLNTSTVPPDVVPIPEAPILNHLLESARTHGKNGFHVPGRPLDVSHGCHLTTPTGGATRKSPSSVVAGSSGGLPLDLQVPGQNSTLKGREKHCFA